MKVSPVDVPFVKHEPFLCLEREDVHILVQVAEDEDFVIVADGLALKEFFWLLQGRFMLVNFIGLSVEDEAVGDPAVVTAEDQDFGVIDQREAAQGVTCGPLLVLVYQRYNLPFLIFERSGTTLEAIKTLDAI